MKNNKLKNENNSSPKLKSSQTDIKEKPIEQPSIILPSSDNKQNNSNNLQNSASSNFVEMNVNNIGDKIINISDQNINILKYFRIPSNNKYIY